MPRPERPLDPAAGPLPAFAAELRKLLAGRDGAQPVQRVQIGNVHSVPVYLFTRPSARCAELGCVIPDPELRPADYLVVSCYTAGDLMTGTHDRVRSAGWYGVRRFKGDVGYLPEIHLEPQYRGGLGLPLCPLPEPLKPR